MHTCTYREAGAADRAPRHPHARVARRFLTCRPGGENRLLGFSSDGRSAIAYRPIAGVAVTVGRAIRPIRPLSISAITEFAKFLASTAACSRVCTVSQRRARRRHGTARLEVGAGRRGRFASRWRACNSRARSGRTCGNRREQSSQGRHHCRGGAAIRRRPVELVHQIRQESPGDGWRRRGCPRWASRWAGWRSLTTRTSAAFIAVGADRKGPCPSRAGCPSTRAVAWFGWTLDFDAQEHRPRQRPTGVMEFLIRDGGRGPFQEEGGALPSASSGAPVGPAGPRPAAVPRFQRLLDMLAQPPWKPVYGFQSPAAIQGQVPPGLPSRSNLTLPRIRPRSARSPPRSGRAYPASPYVANRPCACSPSSAGRAPATAR